MDNDRTLEIPKTKWDPLQFIPSANVLREKLAETERLAERLRILLKLAEEIEATEKED